jgi:hypothetical protein
LNWRRRKDWKIEWEGRRRSRRGSETLERGGKKISMRNKRISRGRKSRRGK